jgi:hypothetical protein
MGFSRTRASCHLIGLARLTARRECAFRVPTGQSLRTRNESQRSPNAGAFACLVMPSAMGF